MLTEDVIQEAFLKTYLKSKSISKDLNFYGWIKVVSRRIAIDLYRKSKTNKIDIRSVDPEIISDDFDINYIIENNIRNHFLY